MEQQEIHSQDEVATVSGVLIYRNTSEFGVPVVKVKSFQWFRFEFIQLCCIV